MYTSAGSVQPNARIIIADDLTPSDTVHFNRRPVVGFVTEVGGRTSHTSLGMRSIAALWLFCCAVAAAQAPKYEVVAIRYGTLSQFPVSALIQHRGLAKSWTSP